MISVIWSAVAFMAGVVVFIVMLAISAIVVKEAINVLKS